MNDAEPQPWKVYRSRFLMLAIFSFFSFTNNMIWITYSPIADLSSTYFGVSDFAVNFLSLIFMFTFLVAGMYAADYIDRKGLRSGLALGATLNALGAAIRILPYPFMKYPDVGNSSSRPGYIFAMVGQALGSVAQTFVLTTPPKVAQKWFPPSERVTATSVGNILNQLGVASGFYLSPLVVRNDASNIPLLMIVQAAICTAAATLVLLFFQSEPPTPPSKSAAASAASALSYSTLKPPTSAINLPGTPVVPNVGVWKLLTLLLKLPGFSYLMNSLALSNAVWITYSTLLGELSNDFGYSSTQAGLLGTVNTLVGVNGALVFAYLADRLRTQHKRLLAVALVGTLLSLIWFAVECKADNFTMLAFVSAIMGFFVNALFPVSFDMAVEIAYPLPEMIAPTIMMMESQIFAIMMVIPLSLIHSSKSSAIGSFWTMVGVQALACSLIFCFHPTFKRQQVENANAIAFESDASVSTPLLHGAQHDV